MFTRLRLRNFKCFKDTGDLDIRPLTFLMGPNSSGKSSILQALLMLRQTADSRDMESPLLLNGPEVTLGSFQDLVFGHECANTLSIEFEVRFVLAPPMKAAFGASFGYDEGSMCVYLDGAWFHEFAPQSAPNASEAPRKSTHLVRGSEGSYTAEVVSGAQSVSVPILRPGKFHYWVPSALGSSEVPPEAREVTLAFFVIDQEFRYTAYLGPLRDWPKRVYLASGEIPANVGARGERSIDALWIGSRGRRAATGLMTSVNRWMKRFNIASRLTLQRLGQTNNYLVVLTDPHSRLHVNFADVGFGASQVLPVLIEGLYCREGATLLIEQPEIHLHPRAQATLGDLLIEIAMSGRGLIVETHSEHLIGRIQLRIAEGSLSRDDVALYYFEPTSGGTEVKRIGINELGQFEPEGLPEGFFEEGYKESLAHGQAIVRRDSPG